MNDEIEFDFSYLENTKENKYQFQEIDIDSTVEEFIQDFLISKQQQKT